MTGRTISHYQLLEKLGAGGMGQIYKAQDTRLSRTVAVKVLHGSGDMAARKRFLQEAQAASALNHPGIITIHDILSEGDTEFLVMEFVAGQTLGELTPPGGMPVAKVIDYAVQMADALSVAHDAGIIHRDLKPGNVMVTHYGLVKILDFGLAKLSGSHAAVSLTDATQTVGGAPLTVEGSIIGTISYMSPEQAEGKPVDARSDIFSFGAVLYEMVTGSKAFTGDSALSTLSAILRDEARPIGEVSVGAPAPLENIIRRCMRKNREERWQTMREVHGELAALKRASDSGILLASLAPAPPAAGKAEKRKKSRTPWIAAGVAAVALAGGAWWAMSRPTPEAAPTPPATPAEPAAQAPPATESPLPSDGVLTNDTVLALVKSGVPAENIVNLIRTSKKTRFNLSASEVARLKQGGVGDPVIAAMRTPAVPPPAAPSEAPKSEPAAAETPTAPAVPTPALRSVTVPDGLPVGIKLVDDIPGDTDAGTPIRFALAEPLRVEGNVIARENAAVTGEIVEGNKRKLIGGVKMTFRLIEVETVEGQKLKVRAVSTKRGAEAKRAVDSATMEKHSKNVAAPAGTRYVAYTDGEQKINVK